MHVTPDSSLGPRQTIAYREEPAVKSMVLMQLLGAVSINEAKFRKRSQRQKINDFNVGR
jgi:hypothetical protein